MEKNAPDKKSRSLLPAACVSLFACFSFLVYGPLDMYSHNISDLWFNASQLLLCMGLAAIAAFAASMLVFYLLRLVNIRLYRGAMALYFGAALAAYLQGNFFNINAVPLAGDSVVWPNLLLPTLLNLGIWLGIILIPVAILCFAPKRFGVIVKSVSLALIVMQLASMTALLINMPPDKKQIYTITQDRFKLSPKENIIVLIADSISTGYMEELMTKDPEALDFLDGFTYYPNTTGAYGKTAGTYAYLMSGKYYLNQQNFVDYCREAFTTDTFWKELKELGYDIHIGENGSGVPYFPEQAEAFSNLVVRQPEVSSYFTMAKLMLKMTGYRFAPDLMRPFLLNDYPPAFDLLMQSPKGQAPVTEKIDPPFYSALVKEKLSAQGEGKAFRLYFLQGAHTPYRMNAKAQRVADNSVSYYEQLKGVFHIFREYLTQLKELGLYDDATIIIMTDHAKTTTLQALNPTFMIKPKGASGALATSLAPISYEDFRPTLMKAAGGDYLKYGTPVDAWNEGDARERKYYIYYWTRIKASDYYFTDIYELAVHGDVRDLNEYQPTGNVYTREGIKQGKPY